MTGMGGLLGRAQNTKPGSESSHHLRCPGVVTDTGNKTERNQLTFYRCKIHKCWNKENNHGGKVLQKFVVIFSFSTAAFLQRRVTWRVSRDNSDMQSTSCHVSLLWIAGNKLRIFLFYFTHYCGKGTRHSTAYQNRQFRLWFIFPRKTSRDIFRTEKTGLFGTIKYPRDLKLLDTWFTYL
jgi:hypothetical protein